MDEVNFDYDKFVKQLNLYMKNDNLACVMQYLHFYTDRIIQRHTADKWTVNPSDFKDGQIAIVAHCIRPIRMLCVLRKKHGSAVNVPDDLQITMTRIIPKKNKDQMTEEKKQPHSLVTTKRGFWVIDTESLKQKIMSPITDTNIKQIRALYQQTQHMTYDVSDEFRASSNDDKGYEQFMLKKYPTQAWIVEHDSTIKERDQKSKDQLQKRNKDGKRDHDSVEEPVVEIEPGRIKTKKPKIVKQRTYLNDEQAAYVLLEFNNLIDDDDIDKTLGDDDYKSEHITIPHELPNTINDLTVVEEYTDVVADVIDDDLFNLSDETV